MTPKADTDKEQGLPFVTKQACNRGDSIVKSSAALNLISRIMTGVFRCSRIAAIAALGGLLFSGTSDAKNLPGCPAWPGQAEGVRSVDGATIRIKAATESVVGESEAICQILITDESGRSLFARRGKTFTIEPISGTDVNMDGLPDIVIRGTNELGYVYFFISAKVDPPVFKTVRNGYGISFERSDDGRAVLVVPDDGFRGLPDLLDIYHYESVVPKIRFMLNGCWLQDVSLKLRKSYDREIEKARSTLTREDIEAFKRGAIKDEFDRSGVKGKVLTIVLSYLYSGREKQAWQALDDMWPQEDGTRIRQVLVNARAKGSLRLTQE